MDILGQIAACKSRIEVVRAYIKKTSAAGNKSTEAEQQLVLEGELLRMLEAQLANAPVPKRDEPAPAKPVL